MTPGNGDREAARALGLVTGIGVYVLVSLAVGVGLGLLARNLLGGNALPLLVGIMLGLFAGGFGAYRMVMRVYR